MGSLTWHGWQTSLEDVFEATGILYGGNLRRRPSENADKTSEQAKDDEQKETHAPRFTHRPASPTQEPETDKDG